MNMRNTIGAVAGLLLAGGTGSAALAGDVYVSGYYNGGGYCGGATYATTYYEPTYYVAPAYCDPQPVYCAPTYVTYASPRVYHRTYSRAYYPARHTYSVYRDHGRHYGGRAYYRGGNHGRGFGFGFSYRD